MKKENESESMDGLLRKIAWHYSSNNITLDELREFMKGLNIGDTDPEYVLELYKRYTDSVHDAAIALQKKMRDKE